jgi:ABC-type glycerol-3-phosphate transport system substrate-binding protein
VLGDLIGKYFPSQTLATGFTDATCAGAKGKALFDNQGAFLNLIIPAEYDKSLKPGKDFTFFLMPKYDASMPDAQFVSGDLFVGAKDTKNKTATLALLDYLASADAQEIWAKRGGYIAPTPRCRPTSTPTRTTARRPPCGPSRPTWPPGTTSTTGSAARSR